MPGLETACLLWSPWEIILYQSNGESWRSFSFIKEVGFGHLAVGRPVTNSESSDREQLFAVFKSQTWAYDDTLLILSLSSVKSH